MPDIILKKRRTGNAIESLEDVMHFTEVPFLYEFCKQRGLIDNEPLKTSALSIRVLERELKAQVKQAQTSTIDASAYNALKTAQVNLTHIIQTSIRKDDDLYFVCDNASHVIPV